MSERKDIFWRAYLIYFGFVIIMLVVLIQTVLIQFEGGKPMFLVSSGAGTEKMPTRTVLKKPRRGQILDVNYTPLVTSLSFYNIHMDPTVPSEELFNAEVANLCIALNDLYPEKTAREYENLIRQGRAKGARYISIHRKATNEERKLLRKMPIFEKGRLKGGLIDNEEIIIRQLPQGEMLRRTLGYQRDGVNGKELLVGLEGAYNDYLKGEPGEEIEQQISTGWKKMGPVTKEAVEGASIVTTIDVEIQDVAHTELMRQLKNQGAKNGCAVVMDVKTGGIKAIVNLIRDEATGEYYESYNHAIGTKEVPGSTFKLASLMALLEDDKISIKDKVMAGGTYKFYNSKLEDSNHGYGYGEITIQQAFELSSNVISRVVNNAYRNDPQAYIDRLKSFGVHEPLGIEIKGEPTPTLYYPGHKNWSGISLPWMSIGYEVQQTPLQTLAFYNAVANNGTFVRPQFVKEIRRGNQLVKEFSPIVINKKICSDKTLKDVQKCLVGVVERGTGSALKSAYFSIAGKTGTALVLNDDLRYGDKGEKRYQASFVGYFPAEEPIYSCIVVISAPSKDIYGASVSGTVFTAIANKVYASSLKYHKAVNDHKKRLKTVPAVKVGNRYDVMQLLREFKIPYASKTDASYVVAQPNDEKLTIEKRYVGVKTVPNVHGMTAKDAVYAIESTGMIARIRGYGKVTSQSIKAGTNAAPGLTVEIILE